MVAVEDSYPFRVSSQKLCYLVADKEKSIKRRSLMILPLITDDIPQDGFVDRSAAYVDCQVFVFVAGFQQLSNRID